MQLPFTILAALLASQPSEPETATDSLLAPETMQPTAAAYASPRTSAQDEDEGEGEEGIDLSYTYIELGFGVLDVDDISDEADTLYGRASLGLFDLLYIFLDYQNQDTDFMNTESDLFGLGAGAHFDVTERLDLLGEASWLTASIDSDDVDLDEDNDGWSAFAGARFLALPWNRGGLEVNGGYRWIDLEGVSSDDETSSWELGTRVHFLKLFSVGAKVAFLEDDDFYGFDARVSF